MPRVGCFLPTYAAGGPIDPDSIRSLARRAEQLGLDHVWVGDHFVWKVGMLSPMPTLASIAAVTQKIRLGTGIYLMNLRHPTITAKDVSSVDVLSEGRVILGIGAGGDNPAEYEAVGAEMAHRGRQLEESVNVVRRLFAQDGEGHDGEYFSHPPFTLMPPPVQDPLPIWIGGRAPAVVERAARIAQGWFPVWVSPERMRSSRESILEQGAREDFAIALNVFVATGRSREQARSVVADHLANAYGLPFDKFERYAVFGNPEDILEGLQPYIDAGMTDVAFNLTGPAPDEQLEALADGVFPELR